MIYIYAFLFAGFACLFAELIYEFTKFTPGHITSIYVILGAILGGFGVYDILLDTFGGGASCLIMNFGYLLVKGGMEGLKEDGLIGIFKGLLCSSSATFAFTIFITVICSFIFKPKAK